MKYVFLIEDREPDGRSSTLGIYSTEKKALKELSILDNSYNHDYYGPHVDKWELDGDLVECCIDTKK
jgi:hypothetical protein